MPDWKQKRYGPGTRVQVAVCTRKGRTRRPESGVLLTSYDIDTDRDQDMPQIKIHSGRIVRGCECFWIPTAELAIRP
jgi:hypothetical protein